MQKQTPVEFINHGNTEKETVENIKKWFERTVTQPGQVIKVTTEMLNANKPAPYFTKARRNRPPTGQGKTREAAAIVKEIVIDYVYKHPGLAIGQIAVDLVPDKMTISQLKHALYTNTKSVRKDGAVRYYLK